MEQSIGVLSLVPPLLVVALAILTKNVLISLLLGVVLGLFLSSVGSSPVLNALVNIIPDSIDIITKVVCDADNVHLLIFLALLGGLIAVMTAAGCAGAFSAFAVRKIKSRTHAQLATLLLGCIIFIDDYFNAITVGNIMVPITDKFRISRAKLAYIIDSTSAPVTILMPVSSWVATVISIMLPALTAYGFSGGGMNAFIHACCYNYYAWFTLLMVFLVAVRKFDIGSMAGFEKSFLETGEDRSVFIDINESVIDDMANGRKGTAVDMIMLITVLVVLSLLFMVSNGGFFSRGVPLGAAFMECDTMLSLVYAVIVTLVLAFVMFVPFGKLSLKQFDKAFIQGIKSMVSAICILIASWAFSEILGDEGLGTGRYVANAVGGWLPYWLMPAVLFVISAFISFTTGASWGAMTIMLPTSIAICSAVDPSSIHAVLGATLSGAVFGDHCSPVSDTTVLSSSGAGCRHLDHVMSQIPYAVIVAVNSIAAFLAASAASSAVVGFFVGLALMLACIFGWDLWAKKRAGSSAAK